MAEETQFCKVKGTDGPVYIFTPMLWSRGDMEFCDKDGKVAADEVIEGDQEVGDYVVRNYAPGWYAVYKKLASKLRKEDAAEFVKTAPDVNSSQEIAALKAENEDLKGRLAEVLKQVEELTAPPVKADESQ